MLWRGLALALLLGACGGDDSGPVDPACEADPPAAIVYLNRDGATLTPGPEDAFANTTILVEEETTLDPHPYGPGNWSILTTCFRAGLSPFDIEVVEEDPGDVDHTEIIFSTTWTDPEVASISSFSCASYPRGIAILLGDLFAESDGQRECELALQQFGVVAAGLDHSYDCRDYMSFLRSGCDGKEWLDEDVACGELAERDCKCDRPSQNSYQTMLEIFGPACTD